MKDRVSNELHTAMQQMHHEGMSATQIGNAFGFHQSTVHFHLSGKRKTPYPACKSEAIAIMRAALKRMEAA
jgi:IS30 family transposase